MSNLPLNQLTRGRCTLHTQEKLLLPEEETVELLQRRGVFWRAGRWDAVVASTQRRVDAGGPVWEVLGSYADPVVAAKVYDRAIVLRGWQVCARFPRYQRLNLGFGHGATGNGP